MGYFYFSLLCILWIYLFLFNEVAPPPLPSLTTATPRTPSAVSPCPKYCVAALTHPGVHSRALSGNASSSSARDLGSEAVVRAFATRALERAASVPAPAATPESSVPGPGGGGGGAGFGPSPRVQELLSKLKAFMEARVMPAEAAFVAHGRGADRSAVPLGGSSARWKRVGRRLHLRRTTQEQTLSIVASEALSLW